MKIVKLIYFLLLITPTLVLGSDTKTIIKEIEKKYSVNFFVEQYDYVLKKNQYSENSFSILKNGCSIELSDNKKPVLMNTKKKDFEFTYLHEISHCILGKDVLYNPIDWKINIINEQKIKIENLIIQNEMFYLSNKKTPLIKVIYHEIFADTLATILYMKNNNNAKKDIESVLKNRKIQNSNPYDTHLSVSAIEDVLNESEEIKNLTIEKLKDKAIKITQIKLLQYIRVEYE